MATGHGCHIKPVGALPSGEVWAPVPDAGTLLGLEGSEEAAQCAHTRGPPPVLPAQFRTQAPSTFHDAAVALGTAGFRSGFQPAHQTLGFC